MMGLFYFFATLFVVVCLFLILLILIQKGRGGGLASAFGGAGGQTAFGSKTGDVLTWATSIVFGIFLLLAVALNLLANHIDSSRGGLTGATPTQSNVPNLPSPPSGDPGIEHKEPMNTNVKTPPSSAPSAMSVSGSMSNSSGMVPTTVPTTLPSTAR